VIFILAVILWFGTNFPRVEGQDAQARMENSYAAQAGQWIEPIFKPMGVDWRVGFGLLSAFAAREVFVSSVAVVFHVADENEDTQAESLLNTMRTAEFPDGTKIFTLSSVLGLMIFFMIALQCMTTVATMHKESGSWKTAWGQVVVFNLVAYVLAVAVVQGLRAIGVA
jgi:ferrous iron transport protein B